MSSHPTKRQQQLLDYMTQHALAEGCPATIREMMGALAVQSPNGIVCHLIALEKKGYVCNTRPGRAHSWVVADLEDFCPHCGGELEP